MVAIPGAASAAVRCFLSVLSDLVEQRHGQPVHARPPLRRAAAIGPTCSARVMHTQGLFPAVVGTPARAAGQELYSICVSASVRVCVYTQKRDSVSDHIFI